MTWGGGWHPIRRCSKEMGGAGAGRRRHHLRAGEKAAAARAGRKLFERKSRSRGLASPCFSGRSGLGPWALQISGPAGPGTLRTDAERICDAFARARAAVRACWEWRHLEQVDDLAGRRLVPQDRGRSAAALPDAPGGNATGEGRRPRGPAVGSAGPRAWPRRRSAA